ncbi:hypothetical protein PISMIDRAFT_687035 [Pisolithus microcarpus 441]|uniref:Uncharacterized protein n=1 Tax=Pisolithus microcarpus 441 TaxID=765257 RepID=A0A0C9YGA9_9AGAM|nr:hypothetical protein BKA83DRAFT_687035 [Pisolithus microcarpus]KIK15676.1 hypothetical protein PISMIDRAFT_687035 [Pisolithus microcarpus 441]
MLPLVESTLPLLRLRSLPRYIPDKRLSTILACVPPDSLLLSSLVRSLRPRPTPCVMLVYVPMIDPTTIHIIISASSHH